MTVKMMMWIVALAALIWTAGCGDDTVSVTNTPPVIDAQTDTTIAVGDTLFLQAGAHDPDGDSVRFGLIVFMSASEIKAGYYPDVDFDGDTGRFSFRPAAEDRPNREFCFTVKDARGGADSTTFVVTVN